MSDKLDDRYVEYDLDNSINVLDFAHGGTGTNTLAANGNILIAQATGDPDPNKALKIADSGWGVGSLSALANWDPNKGPFEERVQVAEAHILDSDIHVPAGGTNSTYLRGDGSWQTISSSASSIYCTDQFTYSNATNVQDVLDDLDQAITNNKITPGVSVGSIYMKSSGLFGYNSDSWSTSLPAGTWRCAISTSFSIHDTTQNGLPSGHIGDLRLNGANISSFSVGSGYNEIYAVYGVTNASGNITLLIDPNATHANIDFPQFLIIATRIS